MTIGQDPSPPVDAGPEPSATAHTGPASRMRIGTGPRLAVVGLLAVAWAVSRAGIDDGVYNGGGVPAFGRFWAAALRPEFGAEFLVLTVEAALVTLAYAILGLALSVVIGMTGMVGLSSLLWPGRALRSVTGLLLAVPRGVHEILWALFLIQIFGFDPLVPVLAIGLPYGAITAKVFADAIDESDPGPYHQLRATGAGRLQALGYGVLPGLRSDLLAYLFYRLECGIRSAAVLGVIGAGGLGFQLDLSFETLRYHEIWTLIAALVVLSGLVEAWSSVVRRRLRTPMGSDLGIEAWFGAGRGDASPRSRSIPVGRATAAALTIGVVLSWWGVGLDPRALLEPRARTLARDVAADLLSPRLGPGGWSELAGATVDTVAMSLLALTLAVAVGLLLGSTATAADPVVGSGAGPQVMRWVARSVLLLARAVPAPIWAFLMVLVLFPGLWPGAVALGIYTAGVLGRLFTESFEDQNPGPVRTLAVAGATPAQAFLYGALPGASPRLVALSLYRWEVVTRETVVVGVVGAGGLGQLVNGHLAARDLRAVVSAVLALIAIAVVIDGISGAIRRRLRGPGEADTATRRRAVT